MMVWAGLVKAARKGGVWDVAQLGSMMCLLYDDNAGITHQIVSRVLSYLLSHSIFTFSSYSQG